jgi:hypothetical protein
MPSATKSGDLTGELGGTRQSRDVREVAEDPPQRRGAAPLANGERILGSGEVAVPVVPVAERHERIGRLV